MKNLLIVLFLLTGIGMHLPAQTGAKEAGNYKVVGYQGKDTLSLGFVSVDAKGNTTLHLGNYQGAIQLIPTDPVHHDITKHLEAISLINSQEKFEAAKAYISDTLSFGALYRSGMWKDYVQHWVGFYARTSKSPEEFSKAFVPQAKKVLDRLVQNHSQTASILTRDLIDFFEQIDLEEAAQTIAVYSMGLDLPEDGRHSGIARRLVVASKLTGNPAPALETENGGQLEVSKLGKALLMFYESGCPNCEVQLEELKKQYEELQRQGIRVISISADEAQDVFEYHSKTFPWSDKLCDLKGFSGKNFLNYGVAATPTIYTIDEKGLVTGRYAKLEQRQ